MCAHSEVETSTLTLTPQGLRSLVQRKLDVKKLRSQRTAEALSVQLSDKLRRSPSNISDIGGLLANISHSLHTNAETVLGFECIVENNREMRRDERRFFRRKRKQERRERAEVEIYRCSNDARKFYQKVKCLTEGYKPRASFCKENANFVIDPQGY